MLYRHFPKIANRKFSILSVDLAETQSKETAEHLFKIALDSGINLYRAGNNPEHCAFLSQCENNVDSSSEFSRILDFTGKTTEELERFLTETKSSQRDLLLLPITSGTDVEILSKAKVLTAIEKATEQGRLLGIGFFAPPNPQCIKDAISEWSGWHFYSTTFNYLHEDLIPVMTEASNEGITLLVTNPFEDGKLEQVPAHVHEIFRNAKVPRRHDEWALRGIWEQQEVTSVLCKTDSTFLLNLRCILAVTGKPNSLPSFEQNTLKKAASEFKELTKNP